MSVPDIQPESIPAAEDAAGGIAGLTRQLELFVRQAVEPMLVTEGHAIVLVNPRAALLLGTSEHGLLGRDVDAVLPGAHPRQSLVHSEVGDGSRGIDLEVSRVAIEGGGPCLAVWTLRDVTAREREAARSEARLNSAQRIAKIGNWEWDVARDEHWWSQELYRMLDIDPDDDESFFDVFMQRLHPDDRPRFEQIRDQVLATHEPRALDVRIVLPDGSERVMRNQGALELDGEGRVVKMSGTLQDVTEQKAIEARLLLSELRYKEAQRIAKIGNWEWNVVTGQSWWSDELYAILEEDPQTYPASLDNFVAKLADEDKESVRIRGQSATMTPKDYEASQVRVELPDGRRKVVEMRVDMRADSRGKPEAFFGTVRDVTERWELQTLLRESEARYESTVELAAIGIAHVDSNGRFVWANQHLCVMLGYSKSELLARTIIDVSHPEDVSVSDPHREDLRLGRAESFKFEKRYVRKDGGVIWVRITGAPRRDEAGGFLYEISAVEDISDRKAAEARVQYLATHDEMTGLPNRVLLNELLVQGIETAREGMHRCAVLFIDLDRFKIVNDSLGHQAGDTLLKEMASRLKRCVGEDDVVARLGGDEFVVLLSRVPDPEAAAEVARKIISATLHPMEIMGHECRVTASIGIATYPENARDAASLLKHADMAMYLAKEEGKNNYQFYSAHSSPMTVEHLVLESHLSHALEQDEFTVQYQPKVDLRTGIVSGAEALLRWWNPELGTVSPAQFIPLAEDTGLIVPIGRWILRAACRQNVAWHRDGLPRMVMAVNLSPRQFKDPALLDDIAEALEETGMAPQLLELEITESMIMHDLDRAVERATAIKALGVRLAIDDFGTGYSSLSQLKRFPIDTLKIDRSFVRDVPDNPEDRAIAEAIISLGRTLGVTVVAEGVETARQLEFLREHDCDELQGYYFGRPCHPDSFADLLKVESTQILPAAPIREAGINVRFK